MNNAEDLVEIINHISSINKITDDILDIDDIESQLKTRLIRFGSDTHDNRSLVDNIKLINHKLNNNKHSIRFAINSGSEISEILFQCEGLPIPSNIVEKFPEINSDEWNACFRLIVLILSAIEDP